MLNPQPPQKREECEAGKHPFIQAHHALKGMHECMVCGTYIEGEIETLKHFNPQPKAEWDWEKEFKNKWLAEVNSPDGEASMEIIKSFIHQAIKQAREEEASAWQRFTGTDDVIKQVRFETIRELDQRYGKQCEEKIKEEQQRILGILKKNKNEAEKYPATFVGRPDKSEGFNEGFSLALSDAIKEIQDIK